MSWQEPTHTPQWHYELQTPVVDGKYIDPKTGEVHSAENASQYSGPPAVDILIRSQHVETSDCMYRIARPFRMEALLCQMTKVIGERKLEVDSLMATTYSIRLILVHDLSKDDFRAIMHEMANTL